MVCHEGRRLDLMLVVVCGRIISTINNQNIGLIYHRLYYFTLLASNTKLIFRYMYIISIETYR